MIMETSSTPINSPTTTIYKNRFAPFIEDIESKDNTEKTIKT